MEIGIVILMTVVSMAHIFCLNRFGKKIRYESRKARADIRKRVKGRFVKAGQAYDYDPEFQPNWSM